MKPIYVIYNGRRYRLISEPVSDYISGWRVQVWAVPKDESRVPYWMRCRKNTPTEKAVYKLALQQVKND